MPETFRTTISLDAEVAEAANQACLPANENRPLSNLVQIALRDWLTARGYLAPTNPAAREAVVQVMALLETPDFAAELGKLLRKHSRKTMTEAAR